MTQRPLELILARNLMSALSTPAFLVDEGGVLVFYNEAAGMLLGKRFEELGTVGAEEWGSLFGPFDESGEPIPYDELPLVIAVRNGRPAHADFEIRSDRRRPPRGRGLGLPDPHRARLAGRDRGLLAGRHERQRGAAGMKVKLWGTRGSIPSPGPETIRYGGNTSCVGVTLSDGSLLALDAGTGIRSLGLALADEPTRLHILLTHLHLDHIQGLVFFAPAFRPQTEIVIWGPASPEASLRDRIARYISAPLSPVEVRELPCDVSFRHCPETEWEIGPARIRAASVTHRGPTLGYRIDDGDSSLAYIPDHEPALGADLDPLEEDWISGFELARDASLLIHDGQYSDAEYPDHVGWGHSPLSHALAFARRTGAERTVLFHHDPLHSDELLDRLGAEARERWAALGGDDGAIELGVERAEYELPARAPSAAAGRPPPPEPPAPVARYAARRCRPPRIEARRRALGAGRAPRWRWRARPTPARSATAAAACPTSTTRSPSPSCSPSTASTTRCWRRRSCTTWSRTASSSVDDVRERFGERVAELVEALTDDESIEPYARAQGRAPRAGSRRPAATRWRSTPPTS